MKTREDLLLIQLGEECNEVGQNISKALRFGPDEIYYKLETTNAEKITQEMQDLVGVFNMLVDEGILPVMDPTKIAEKKGKVNEYMGYSKELGIIS
jgi:hypothetical protein